MNGRASTAYPADEDAELKSLRALLSRTSHTPRHIVGAQCGTHATSHLKWLDDGQRDDMATLRRRREMEDYEAAAATGRQPWDSSTWKYVPMALKGVQPVTPEPWAHDSRVYAQGMNSGHGVRQSSRRTRASERFVSADGGAGAPPKHAQMIENAMLAYRRDLGSKGPGSPNMSPRISARGSSRGSARGAAGSLEALMGLQFPAEEPKASTGGWVGWFGSGEAAAAGGSSSPVASFADPPVQRELSEGEPDVHSSPDVSEASPQARKGARHGARTPIHFAGGVPSPAVGPPGRAVSSTPGRAASGTPGRAPASRRGAGASSAGAGAAGGGGGGCGGGGGGGSTRGLAARAAPAAAQRAPPSQRSSPPGTPPRSSSPAKRPRSPASPGSPGSPTSVMAVGAHAMRTPPFASGGGGGGGGAALNGAAPKQAAALLTPKGGAITPKGGAITPKTAKRSGGGGGGGSGSGGGGGGSIGGSSSGDGAAAKLAAEAPIVGRYIN